MPENEREDPLVRHKRLCSELRTAADISPNVRALIGRVIEELETRPLSFSASVGPDEYDFSKPPHESPINMYESAHIKMSMPDGRSYEFNCRVQSFTQTQANDEYVRKS